MAHPDICPPNLRLKSKYLIVMHDIEGCDLLYNLLKIVARDRLVEIPSFEDAESRKAWFHENAGKERCKRALAFWIEGGGKAPLNFAVLKWLTKRGPVVFDGRKGGLPTMGVVPSQTDLDTWVAGWAHDKTEMGPEQLRMQEMLVQVAKDADDETKATMLDNVLEHFFQGARGLLTKREMHVPAGQKNRYFGGGSILVLTSATHETLATQRKMFEWLDAERSTVVAPENAILSNEGYEKYLSEPDLDSAQVLCTKDSRICADTLARWSQEHGGMLCISTPDSALCFDRVLLNDEKKLIRTIAWSEDFTKAIALMQGIPAKARKDIVLNMCADMKNLPH